MSDLVQPIIVRVDENATHEDAVLAAATASVRAWQADRGHPAWNEWLSGAFTKVARRAKPAVFEALADGFVEHGTGQAVAYPPMLPAELPKNISKLQVAGTDLPRAGSSLDLTADAVIVVNAGLDMTTGKTSAQAAHALFALSLHHPCWSFKRAELLEVPASEFAVMLESKPFIVPIVDAGRTETEPGTTTCFAYRRA
ncbi:aminoacyl-tRNA hydrolase [Agromyces sp. NPDC057679]|uniref:aminoacyl-tRNA hydrolase n=1 Tax=Agromyces sp. NPDC057679 TaxID=3346207 RepID=UPI00366AFE53